jgi:tetratricopeptide (TPR) repeat protein
MTRQEVLELEFRARVQEGQVLYYRREFYPAIESFTKVITIKKNALGILIDRANCYVQVGRPRAALIDINTVLGARPEDSRALLAKAEAFFSMGEFEFALVFFHKGLAIRGDVISFRDGVTKAKAAIVDSINGAMPFQPNRNFVASRRRTPPLRFKTRTPLDSPDDDGDLAPADLLPEDVPPLAMTREEKGAFLGELALDYDYLIELREEILAGRDSGDEKILEIVNNALRYLEQRAQFWSQQIAADPIGRHDPAAPARISPPAVKAAAAERGAKRSASARRAGQPDRKPHYEMSKLQLYDAKYGPRET